ncbi:hypothetical protein KY328_04885 [Candidatus Woesearchaeota archaeon]|nr:hypothetical protein [Candidatus Woesearchaeota archaeon]
MVEMLESIALKAPPLRYVTKPYKLQKLDLNVGYRATDYECDDGNCSDD